MGTTGMMSTLLQTPLDHARVGSCTFKIYLNTSNAIGGTNIQNTNAVPSGSPRYVIALGSLFMRGATNSEIFVGSTQYSAMLSNSGADRGRGYVSIRYAVHCQ